MKQEVKIGQQDYTVLILIRDTAGAPKTGLTNASAGLDVCYTRVETDNDVVLTAGAPVALATPALTDVHLDWGFLEVDATNAPGLYRLDIADGVFASGAWSAVVSLIGTGLDPTQIEFVLVPEAPSAGVYLAPTQGSPVFAALSVTGQLDAGNLLIDTTTVFTGTTTFSGNVALSATLTISGLTSMTAGVQISNSVLDNPGLSITGNGAGQGVIVTGGGTSGSGVAVVGGAPNGVGFYIRGDGAGSGLRTDGGDGDGPGIQVIGGATNGAGIYITGTGTGHGVTITSGAGATGNGINVLSAATNGFGASITGVGSGTGLIATGGLTGNGIQALGGGTSGHGLYAKAAGTGHGISANGGGVAGDGLHAEADNDGDGLEGVGTGVGGIDIKGDITGNITGTLATLTTYTGNTPQTGDSFAQLGVAGVGLTAVPWNAAWDAEVQSEVADALNAAMPAAPTADSLNQYIQQLKWVLVNLMAITEANGNTVGYKDDDLTEAYSVAGAFATAAGVTTRKRLET